MWWFVDPTVGFCFVWIFRIRTLLIRLDFHWFYLSLLVRLLFLLLVFRQNCRPCDFSIREVDFCLSLGRFWNDRCGLNRFSFWWVRSLMPYFLLSLKSSHSLWGPLLCFKYEFAGAFFNLFQKELVGQFFQKWILMLLHNFLEHKLQS